ncbi:hypothetical protein HPB47_005112 [Ixodes persulcatus]|uniref:Uncharacterized protein n=1 Tax=Ixodes persulcatus TaxID=34615 RepID=A0AC60PET1_IXOPE|nr:hypothetical protein HPB47_005112 [Ixodes persulcatus]
MPRRVDVEDSAGGMTDFYCFSKGKVTFKMPQISLFNGIAWIWHNRTMFYSDYNPEQTYAFDFGVGTGDIHGLIGNVIPYAQDNRQLMVCMEKGVYRLDTDTLHQTLLAELVDSPEPTRFNDGKCDAAGRLWAGTMPRIVNFEKLPQGGHHLYSYSKGRLSLKASEMSLSNGITWTSDNRTMTMFHNDSFPGRTSVFDYDLDTGAISNRRVLVEFKSTPEYRDLGIPDGMTIDVNNKLWMVCFGAGSVIQVDPETGNTDMTSCSVPSSSKNGSHELSCPTSGCAEDDDDRGCESDISYLFLAALGSPQELACRWPPAGCKPEKIH